MYTSSSDEVKKWKMYTVIVAVGFVIIGALIGGLVGYSYGLNHGTRTYMDLNTFTDNLHNLFIADYSCMEAVDTARAAAFLLDAHGYIHSILGGELSEENEKILYVRQEYFADRTVTLLDLAYESVNNIKTQNKEANTKLELLKSKILELESLAAELRTIAYKHQITEDDRERALAIVKNMDQYRDDIHNIVKDIIDILYQEAMHGFS